MIGAIVVRVFAVAVLVNGEIIKRLFITSGKIMSQSLTLRLTLACMGLLGAHAVAHAVAVSGQGTWEQTLQARDLDGNKANGAEAYYDTTQNITWLADANYLKTSGAAWADADGKAPMITTYGGYPWRSVNAYNMDWVLPVAPYSSSTINQDAANSQLKNLFEKVLGNKSTNGVYVLSNTGPFLNIQSGSYLTNVLIPEPSNNYVPYSFAYSAVTGLYSRTSYNTTAYAMFNTVGDFGTPVPEASTWGMLLLGLLGVGLARARKATTVGD
jgi:hypothetical protein